MTAPDPALPPVKNRPLYVYRIFVKWFSFFIFGLGTVILLIFVFPLLRLFLHPREKFRRSARFLVSRLFGVFILIMRALGGIELDAGDPRAYRCLSSKIIAANHPSLLDAVMLIFLIPNADCIVGGHLQRTIVRGIIRQIYIPNSLDFEELLAACKDSLDRGNCLIIFPEGTRTPRGSLPVLKRGAARLSLSSGYPIIPLYIGGTDKYGLGKRDPWFSFNHQEKYVYRIRMQQEISPSRYSELPVPLAVRHLTSRLKAVFLDPDNK